MDKNKFFVKNGPRPSVEQRMLTKLFYRHANEVYASFEDWKGYESVSGWFVRGEALRNQLDSDKLRYKKYKLLHPGVGPAPSKDLLKFIGLREEDLIQPPEKHKITRTRLGKSRWLVSDSGGGFVIVEK